MDMKRNYYEDVQFFSSRVVVFWFCILIVFLTVFSFLAKNYNPEIIQLVEREIDKVNEALARVEQVKKFTILPKKLYEEDGEMTPTMKVKRKFINEAFADLIEAMY